LAHNQQVVGSNPTGATSREPGTTCVASPATLPLMTSSETQKFGAVFVGEKFQWYTSDKDGEPIEHEFRARSMMSFDDVITYKQLLAQHRLLGDRLIDQLKQRGAALDTDDDADDDEERWDEVQRLADLAVESERERYELLLQATLMLVHPPHADELRPLLEESNPADVAVLREWLVKKVIDRIPEQVEAAAGVDPTSPPQPSSSPSSTTGGEVSDETEPTSTG
jgi:hypothetical protein